VLNRNLSKIDQPAQPKTWHHPLNNANVIEW
jgi:hypothetical protein